MGFIGVLLSSGGGCLTLDPHDGTPGLSPCPAHLVTPAMPLAPTLRAQRAPAQAGSFHGTEETYLPRRPMSAVEGILLQKYFEHPGA
jgi:hypothetical protein